MIDLIVLCLIGLVIYLLLLSGKNPPSQTTTTVEYIRCPTCGAQAKVRGDVWECGWCADCGRVKRR